MTAQGVNGVADATLAIALGPDELRLRLAAFVALVAVSLGGAAFLLARKYALRRRAAGLGDAARKLPLDDVERLIRLFGRDGAAALLAAVDSPTAFDREFATILRDAAARRGLPLADAERLHGVRLALGHGRAPGYRALESTRDLDPQRMVLLRSRPAIVAEVRENGILLLELGRRRHPIERGHRFRLVVEPPGGGGAPLHAEVSILDAAANVALVAHAPLAEPDDPPSVELPGALA